MIQTLILFLIAFLVGSDQFLLGPILAPVGADLGVAPAQITLFIGAYALPLAVLAPVFGGLSDRFGRRRILLPAVAVFCLGSLATTIAPNYIYALASRIITGIGAAGMLPVAFALAASSGPLRAPKSIAKVQAGLTGGIILGPVYGAWTTSAYGWHTAFAGLAVLAAIIAVGIGLFGGHDEQTGARPALKMEFVPGALRAIMAFGLGLGGAIGIYALAGERLRQLADIGTAEIGLIYAGFGIFTLLGNLGMPYVMGRLKDGRRLMRLCLFDVLAMITALFALPLGLLPAIGAMAIWAFLGGLGAPGLQAHLAGLSPQRRGMLMALGSSAMNLGVAIWSSLAAAGFSVFPQLVALQALLTIGVAILVLKPISEPALPD